MSTSDERILKTLRAQAWERAKGELKGMLNTYWDGHGNDNSYKSMAQVTEQFISRVEEAGWHE